MVDQLPQQAEEFTGIREMLYLVELVKDDYQMATRFAQPAERGAFRSTADEPLIRGYGPVPYKGVGRRHRAFPTLLALSHSANSPTRIRSRPFASCSSTSRANRSRTSSASSCPTSREVIT